MSWKKEQVNNLIFIHLFSFYRFLFIIKVIFVILCHCRYTHAIFVYNFVLLQKKKKKSADFFCVLWAFGQRNACQTRVCSNKFWHSFVLVAFTLESCLFLDHQMQKKKVKEFQNFLSISITKRCFPTKQFRNETELQRTKTAHCQHQFSRAILIFIKYTKFCFYFISSFQLFFFSTFPFYAISKKQTHQKKVINIKQLNTILLFFLLLPVCYHYYYSLCWY